MKHPNPISSNNCPLRNLILHVRELVQGPAGCVKKMITDTAQLIVIIFSNTVYFYWITIQMIPLGPFLEKIF